jgi:hypothetical protein
VKSIADLISKVKAKEFVIDSSNSFRKCEAIVGRIKSSEC